MNLGDLSKKELQQLKKDVDQALADFDKRKRSEALAAAKAAAQEAGFSLAELLPASKSSAKSLRPPKFRHPEDASLTWSGRGRQPDWFKELVESGVSRDSLLV